MSSVLVAGDVELAAVLWAKSVSSIVEAANHQIGMSIPNQTPPLPYLEVIGVGETNQVTDPLIVNARIQFNCWGKVNDKATTSALARAVQTAAHNLTPTRFAVPQGVTTLHGAVVDQVLWVPEPESNYARHTVDVIFTATTIQEES